LVKFKPGYAPELADAAFGSVLEESYKKIGWRLVRIPSGKTIAQAEQYYKSLRGVAAVNRNYLGKAHANPSDPLYAQQYGPQQISAPSAWGLVTGRNTTVAILDTGLDTRHEEFLAVGKIHAPMDVADNDTDVTDDSSPFNGGHGTHCAGIAAAPANGRGVVGVAYDARILPVKIFGRHQLSFAYSDLAKGIIHAADNGANVISMSVGGFSIGPNQMLQDAADYAWNRNVVLIASAGNDGLNVPEYFNSYGIPDVRVMPADLNHVVSVAASDRSDRQSSFTNFGNTVDITGPGVNVLSTVPGGYASYSGTSMSGPAVAGAAALVWSHAPTGTTNAQVVDALMKTSLAVGRWINGGRVDAFRAVKFINKGLPTSLAPTVANVRIPAGQQNVQGSLAVAGDLDEVNIRSGYVRGLGNVAGVDATFQLTSSPSLVRNFTISTQALPEPGATIQIFLRDMSSAAEKWELVNARPFSGTMEIDLGLPASRFIGSGNSVQAIVRVLKPQRPGMTPFILTLDKLNLVVARKQ
jgi:thermitase